MSKPIKNMIVDNYRRRFDKVDGGVVINITGITSNESNKLRKTLGDEGIRVTVVKNSLARHAIKDTSLEALGEILEGPSAIVYGKESVVVVARKLLAVVKEMEKLEIKGAVMEGTRFGAKDVTALSKYPTRQEAQASAVGAILSPARKLVGSIKSPAANIAGILKTVQEKLEKGETIAKVG